MRASVWRVLVVSSLMAVGCSRGERVDLLLDLKTDLVAGTEFARVRTERFSRIPREGEVARGSQVRERSADFAANYVEGRRVAVFSGLEPGTHAIRMRLIGVDNAIVLERVALVTLRRTSVFTLVLTRDCRGVICPEAGDDPDLLACVGGRCVRPECTPEAPEFCPAFSCEVDASCLAAAACAEARCTQAGICLRAVDHTRCASDQWCDPDRGCRSFDEGMGDGGTVDSGSDGGVVTPGQTLSVATVGADGQEVVLGQVRDADGNRYITGLFNGTTDFGDGPVTSASGDVFIVSYGTTGALRWFRTFGSDLFDGVVEPAIDEMGNLYIAGDVAEDRVDFGAGPVDGGDSGYVYVASYDTGGVLRWITVSQGVASTRIETLVRSADGNLYVAGRASGNPDFGEGPVALENDIFLWSLDFMGDVNWVKTFPTAGVDFAHALAVDGSGRVHLTGTFSDTVDLGGGVLTGSGDQPFLAIFGSDGIHERSLLWPAPVSSLRTDPEGYLYTVGRFSDSVDFGSGARSPAGIDDGYIARHDASLALGWVRVISGAHRDWVGGLDLDGDGVLVSGRRSTGSDLGAGAAMFEFNDIWPFVARYRKDGALDWARSYAGLGESSDSAVAHSVEAGDPIIVTGTFRGTFDFGFGPITSTNSTSFPEFNDIFVLTLAR